jgi:hypothetical protein
MNEKKMSFRLENNCVQKIEDVSDKVLPELKGLNEKERATKQSKIENSANQQPKRLLHFQISGSNPHFCYL